LSLKESRMTIEDFNTDFDRKVWVNRNGIEVLTVTDMLEEGEYDVETRVNDDGNVVLECLRLSDC